MTRYFIVVIFMLVAYSEALYSANRVLLISSYGTDYQWSNTIMDAIGQQLNEEYPTIEISKEFLSSELLEDADMWGDKISVLLRNYQKKPPLAVVLISDEAWMAYRNANLGTLKNVPILLCGVKPHSISAQDFIHKKDTLALSDFTPTTELMKKYNATGILREMNVPGYLTLMNKMITGLNRFVFITDSRFYGVYTRLFLEQESAKRYPEIPVEYIDARYVDTDSLLNRLSDVPSTAGVLLTSWLTGEYGFEYSKDYVYSQMENILNTPIFITNNIGMDKGYFVGGYFNNSAFWGNKTAEILLKVINGENVSSIKPQILHDDECQISWKVLNHYKLDSSRLPAKFSYCDAPESFFVTYKYYIIGVLAVFLIFLVFYFYTLRSNIRLHHAQKQLLKSVEETKISNLKLEKTKSELTVALRKAEESDRLKTAFLANMSHEIRTPLNAIVGFSGVIDEVDKDERAEYVELIQRNSDLLLQLLSDILDLSRIEAGMLEFSFSPVDALGACSNVVSSLQSKCKPGVRLFLNESVTSMPLHTDPNRLMQILINLVNNAMKFTSEGSIEVGYRSFDVDKVEFYVKDTGVGMSKDKLSAIFERFTKLNSYVEGTGLGLSICKTIVEALGGEIGVESEEGVGTCFWFRIQKCQSEL